MLPSCVVHDVDGACVKDLSFSRSGRRLMKQFPAHAESEHSLRKSTKDT